MRITLTYHTLCPYLSVRPDLRRIPFAMIITFGFLSAMTTLSFPSFCSLFRHICLRSRANCCNHSPSVVLHVGCTFCHVDLS